MTEKERKLALFCLKANSDYHSEICEECIKYPCSHRIQDDVTETIIKELEQESQSKTGHWIEHKHGAIEHIECSECGIWFLKADLPRKSYCPNCGSCNGDMIKSIMRDIGKQ